MNDNKIEDCSAFKGVNSNLKFLSLANNRVRDLTPFSQMPDLEEFYIGGNKLTSIEELEMMPSLRVFNVRGNRLPGITGVFVAPKLEYINLRDNAKMEKTAGLEKLATFQNLQKANFQGCPMADGDDFKKEVLILTEDITLAKINKEDVTEEDRQEARDLKAQRIADEEEKRRAEEEAAANAEGENQEEGEEENNE